MQRAMLCILVFWWILFPRMDTGLQGQEGAFTLIRLEQVAGYR
jgi:hypothetical protein